MKLRNYRVVFFDGQTATVAAQRCYCADQFFGFVTEVEEDSYREAPVAAYAAKQIQAVEVRNG